MGYDGAHTVNILLLQTHVFTIINQRITFVCYNLLIQNQILFGKNLEVPTIVPERFEAAQTEDATQRPA